MIAALLLRPGSKLRVERELGPAGQSTLADLLDVRNASADDLYAAMDWLAPRQHDIERQLAAAHLEGAPLALYDVSSTWKARAANLPPAAIPATTAATGPRSSTACCC